MRGAVQPDGNSERDSSRTIDITPRPAAALTSYRTFLDEEALLSGKLVSPWVFATRLDYLARYVFRIAIVNSRLERFEDGHVTFRYRDGRTGTTKRCTLDAVSFIDRFLQHVLPQGFAKVRHYGLFSPSRHDLLTRARAHLVAAPVSPPAPALRPVDPAAIPALEISARSRCPACGIGLLHIVETLPPGGRAP